MKKIFTRLIGVTLGLAMAVGVGVGVVASNKTTTKLNAIPAVAATLTFTLNNSTKVQDYTSSFDQADSNSDNWTLNLFNNNNWGWSSSVSGASKQVKCGNKTTATVATIQNKEAFTDVTYTKIDLYISAYTSSKFNSIKIYGSNVSSFATKTELASKTDAISTSTTVPTSLTLSNTSNYNYYRLAFDTDNGGSSNGFITLDKVVFYHEDNSTPTVTVSAASAFLRAGGASQTVTATPSNFSGDVSYSWAYQSGVDCVDLTNDNTATVTMAPKSSIVSLSTGVYRVTATYSSESAYADVSVTVDKGGSSIPYTVAEARAAIDSGVGKENAYVKGIIYQIDGYNSTYHSITYWISDDGSNSVPFEVYSGLNVGGTNFSGVSDLSLGDIVVVTGELKKSGSTYEFNYDNQLVSRICVASIAVKTTPTKVDYNSSENFDPTGLVITATYNDTPDPTTKDFAYADLATAFSFSPSTSTALTDEESVSITLFGKSVSQAITVTARTIISVTLMGDMSNKSYYVGDSWDLTGLYLSITWNIGEPNPTTVNLADVDPSNYELDEDAPVRDLTSLYIYGMYEGEEFDKTITGITVNRRPIEDLLRTASTSFNLTKTSYTDFSNKRKTLADLNSEATWAGTAACNTSKSNALQLNGTSRGIYTTASSQYIKSVSVSFNDHNNQSLYFYASNTAYTAINASVSSDENSTLVATLNKDALSANISGNYKYLYIYSSGAIYMNSITVTWKFATDAVETVTTRSSLAYNATKNGENDYSFSSVYLRFGGIVSESFWDQLHEESTITSYGVLLSTNEYLSANELKSKYNAVDGTNVKKFSNAYDPLSEEPNKSPKLYEDSTYQGVEDNYYVWNLRCTIAEVNYTRVYAAVAFIVTENDGVVFLGENRKSVKSIAVEMIAGPSYDASSFEGSLNYLANLAGEL